MDFDLPAIYSEIDRQAAQFGVDPVVAKSFLTAENTGSGSTSSRDTYSGAATSPKGAQGLMQVMPATARGLQQAGFLPQTWKYDAADLGSQVQAGLAAIKEMQGRQKRPGDVLELGAMYNGGNEGQKNYLAGTLTNPETVKYLQKVQRAHMELTGTPLTPQQIERQAASGSASTRTSYGRTSFDSSAIDAVIGQLGGMNEPGGLYDQAYGAISDRTGAVSTAGADWQMAIDAVGDAAGLTAKAKATRDAEAATVRAKILADSNVDPRANNNAMQQSLSTIDQTSAAIEQLRPEVDSLMAVGIDTPIDWLLAQIQLPTKVQQYNNLVRQQQDAIGVYDARSGIASKQISLGTALSADRILEVGAAEASEDAAKAVEKQKGLQYQLASKSAADALNTVQLANQQLQGMTAYANLTKVRESEATAAREAAKAQKLNEQSLADVNQLIVAAGGTGVNWERLKQLPAKVREDLLTAASAKKFGATLGEAVTFVDSFGSVQGMAAGGQLGVTNWLGKTLNNANAIAETARQTSIAKGDKNFNPQKAKLQAIDLTGTKYQTEAEGDLRRATQGNPFILDYLNAVKAPELADNMWAQMIQKYGPTGDNTIPKLDEQQLVGRAIAEIQAAKEPGMSGNLVRRYAADIANFYKTATANQAKETKYALFGMYKPQRTYGVNMPEYMLTPTEVLDMGNQAQVEKFLTKQSANAFMRTMKNSSNFGLYS